MLWCPSVIESMVWDLILAQPAKSERQSVPAPACATSASPLKFSQDPHLWVLTRNPGTNMVCSHDYCSCSPKTLSPKYHLHCTCCGFSSWSRTVKAGKTFNSALSKPWFSLFWARTSVVILFLKPEVWHWFLFPCPLATCPSTSSVGTGHES